MLQINQDQLNSLERADVPHFEQQTVEQLKKDFPNHCRFLSDEALDETVSYGIRQAAQYGLTNQAGARLYIDLMFLLGRRFDDDPQLPWAWIILTDTTSANPMDKTEWLYSEAALYLQMVMGPNGEFIDEALGKVLNEPIEVPAEAVNNYVEFVAARLQYIWPRKFDTLGEGRIQALIQDGKTMATEHRLNESGALVFICLMYLLGSRFDKDPAFLWAGNILNDTREQNPVKRTEKLYAAAIDHLHKWRA